MEQVLDLFTHYLINQQLTAHTIRAYLQDNAHFIVWLRKQEILLDQLRHSHIQDYFVLEVTKKFFLTTTLRRKKAALKSFLVFLWKEKLIACDLTVVAWVSLQSGTIYGKDYHTITQQDNLLIKLLQETKLTLLDITRLTATSIDHMQQCIMSTGKKYLLSPAVYQELCDYISMSTQRLFPFTLRALKAHVKKLKRVLVNQSLFSHSISIPSISLNTYKNYHPRR